MLFMVLYVPPLAGSGVAIGLVVAALRRIARNTDQTVTLLGKLLQRYRYDPEIKLS